MTASPLVVMDEDVLTAGPTGSLWESLGLPPPEDTVSQHGSRRVVLLGRPLSGKRSLCRRMAIAAAAQYPHAHGGPDAVEATTRGAEGSERRPLYRLNDDGEKEDSGDEVPAMTGDGVPAASPASSSSALRQAPVATAAAALQSKDMPHGAGIAHHYVVQRVPYNRSSSLSRASPTTRRQVVEFFCCDTAGSLAAALPTPQSIEAAVVVVVVDLGQPDSIREQLDRCFGMLNAHVSRVLQTFMPNQDEVRRLELTDMRRAYWTRQSQLLSSSSPSIQADEVGAASGTTLEDSGNTTGGGAAAAKTVIVCTKADILERISNMSEDPAVSADTKIVSEGLQMAARRSGLSLLDMCAQLVRQYAMEQCSALIAVSNKVNATATDGGAVSTLVHPFYRAVWHYISYLASDNNSNNNSDTQTTLPQDIVALRSTSFFPTAFLPCGADRMSDLSPLIATKVVAFPSSGMAHAASDEHMKDSFSVSIERASSPEAFRMHHAYLLKQLEQQTVMEASRAEKNHYHSHSSEAAAANQEVFGEDGNEELSVAERGDGEELIWDSL